MGMDKDVEILHGIWKRQQKEIENLERQNKVLRGVLEDFILTYTHAQDCNYWDFADEGCCNCMDRTYYNETACLNRADKALKEVDGKEN